MLQLIVVFWLVNEANLPTSTSIWLASLVILYPVPAAVNKLLHLVHYANKTGVLHGLENNVSTCI